jgi:hypothetical protein
VSVGGGGVERSGKRAAGGLPGDDEDLEQVRPLISTDDTDQKEKPLKHRGTEEAEEKREKIYHG